MCSGAPQSGGKWTGLAHLWIRRSRGLSWGRRQGDLDMSELSASKWKVKRAAAGGGGLLLHPLLAGVSPNSAPRVGEVPRWRLPAARAFPARRRPACVLQLPKRKSQAWIPGLADSHSCLRFAMLNEHHMSKFVHGRAVRGQRM